jgi:hypothetical protein
VTGRDWLSVFSTLKREKSDTKSTSYYVCNRFGPDSGLCRQRGKLHNDLRWRANTSAYQDDLAACQALALSAQHSRIFAAGRGRAGNITACAALPAQSDFGAALRIWETLHAVTLGLGAIAWFIAVGLTLVFAHDKASAPAVV